jgi:hypothetical protein
MSSSFGHGDPEVLQHASQGMRTSGSQMRKAVGWYGRYIGRPETTGCSLPRSSSAVPAGAGPGLLAGKHARGAGAARAPERPHTHAGATQVESNGAVAGAEAARAKRGSGDHHGGGARVLARREAQHCRRQRRCARQKTESGGDGVDG